MSHVRLLLCGGACVLVDLDDAVAASEAGGEEPTATECKAGGTGRNAIVLK
jgi:hypothetical protein